MSLWNSSAIIRFPEMLPIRNISYLLPLCCSFWEKCKNSPKTGLGCSTPLKLGEKYTLGPRYWNVPVLVNTGTFQYWWILGHFGCQLILLNLCVEDEAWIRLRHYTCQSLTEGKLDWELGRFYTGIAWKCAIYVL